MGGLPERKIPSARCTSNRWATSRRLQPRHAKLARIQPAPATRRGESMERTAKAAKIAGRIRANGSVCFRAFGGSMYPWIRPGDIVFARRIEIEHARLGEVVLFERGGRV